jgi:hypothetical protein
MPLQPTYRSPELSEPGFPAPGRSPGLRGLNGGILAIVIVGLSFLIHIGRPFEVLSDMGYQALSARQYFDHYTPVFYSLRVVDPKDLSRDVVTLLDAWTPTWAALFLIAFKAGLSSGTAGRVLAFLLSLAGALGWVRVSSILCLRGRWRIAGIFFAAAYCLRTNSVAKLGQNDLIVYAVAPWLFAAAYSLSIPLSSDSRNRIAARTAILCLCLGMVYWLKYNAIFLSIAILIALLVEQFGSIIRKRLLWSLALMALYGVTFAAPAIALKIYNYSRSGTDFLEASSHHSPPRTPARLLGFISGTAFNAAPVLFSAEAGSERLAGNFHTPRSWLARAPGLLLLLLIFYLMLRRPPSWIRNMTILCAAVPLVIFPSLSFATGPRFTFVLGRSCEAYWIFLELMVFKLLAEKPRAAESVFLRIAWNGLAVAAAFQAILFLWIPYVDLREILRSPGWTYQTTASRLYEIELSQYGTRDIVQSIQSQVHGPNDVIVLAAYSDHSYGTDVMQEFVGDRLLQLTSYAKFKIHSVPASDYFSSEPFRSSAPLRIILVATDPYRNPDFRQSTERVMNRFPQVRQWNPGPADPHGRVWIWIGEIG